MHAAQPLAACNICNKTARAFNWEPAQHMQHCFTLCVHPLIHQLSSSLPACMCRNDGLFIGSSAAVNCVGAVKVARALGPGHTIVTVLCDGGARHLSKFHNPEYLKRYGLAPEATGCSLEFVHAA